MTGAIQRTNKLQTGFLVAAAAILVVVGLPVLAFLSVFGRVVLIGAVVAGGVAVLAVPNLRRRFIFAEPAPDHVYKGLRLPEGVLFHPTHSWARLVPGMKARIGIDDLAQRALGPAAMVDLPQEGTMVRQGDRLFTLRRGGRSLEVKAPLSGRVVAHNQALRDDPALVNGSPYQEGWALELAAVDLDADERRLSTGSGATQWFRAEIDRFIGALMTPAVPSQVLADGGLIADDIHRAIDDETWAKLETEFFGGEA